MNHQTFDSSQPPFAASQVYMDKDGGQFCIMGTCLIAGSLTPGTIFKGLMDGQIWTMPSHEFHDGRFTLVSKNALNALSASILNTDAPLQKPVKTKRPLEEITCTLVFHP